jgi:hypothetical protein
MADTPIKSGTSKIKVHEPTGAKFDMTLGDGSSATFYPVKIEFEDGTVGEANSKHPSGNYKVNELVEYEAYAAKKEGKPLRIKIKKRVQDAPHSGGYNDPVMIARQVLTISTILTVKFFQQLAKEPASIEMINDNKKFFAEWLGKDLQSKDTLYQKRDCLESAILCIGFPGMTFPFTFEKVGEKVMKTADFFYQEAVKATTNEP